MLVTWQLAHHCWASWLPLAVSACEEYAAMVPSNKDTSMTAGSLHCMVLAPTLSSGHRERVPVLAIGPWLQRPAELLCGLVQLGSMLLVELRTRGQRFSQLDENVRQESVMHMNHHLAPILPRSHQPDGDAIVIGISIELRMPGKAADIGLVGKID